MAEEKLKVEAQKALDELWRQRRLPFKLTAYRIRGNLADGYQIDSFDSRLPSMTIRWDPAHGPFKAAVLEKLW